MTGDAALSSAGEVGRLLGPYLSEKLGTPVHFARGPTAVTSGWETYIFAFRLAAAVGQAPPAEPPELLDRDLILRVYQGDIALAKGRREFHAQMRLAGAGYPAPRPFLFEKDPSLFGRPFMIMEKLPGRPMMEVLAGARPLTGLEMMRLLGESHARLHDLDAGQLGLDEPDRPGPLEQALRAGRELVDEHGVRALTPLLAWLEERAADLPQGEPSVLHLDFHPLNVLVEHGEVSGVLDWPGVTVGDPHLDVASTVTLLATGPIGDDVPAWARVLLPALRRVLVSRYLASYRRQRPLDRQRLRFYEVAAALRWLVFSQLFRYIKPEAIGVKAESSALVSQREVDALRRFIRQRTGLDLKISLAELGPPASA